MPRVATMVMPSGGEVHEVLHGRNHELEQILGAEHVQHADGLSGAGVLVVERHEGKGEGQDAGDHQRIDEEHGDVGQLVTGGLHSVQEAVQSAAGLLSVRRHGGLLKMIEPLFSGSWKNRTQHFALLKDKTQANSAFQEKREKRPTEGNVIPQISSSLLSSSGKLLL